MVLQQDDTGWSGTEASILDPAASQSLAEAMGPGSHICHLKKEDGER